MTAPATRTAAKAQTDDNERPLLPLIALPGFAGVAMLTTKQLSPPRRHKPHGSHVDLILALSCALSGVAGFALAVWLAL